MDRCERKGKVNMARILNEMVQVAVDQHSGLACSTAAADVSVACDVEIDSNSVDEASCDWLCLSVKLLRDAAEGSNVGTQLFWVEIGSRGPTIRKQQLIPARIVGTYGFTRHCRVEGDILPDFPETRPNYIARFTLSHVVGALHADEVVVIKQAQSRVNVA